MAAALTPRNFKTLADQRSMFDRDGKKNDLAAGRNLGGNGVDDQEVAGIIACKRIEDAT